MLHRLSTAILSFALLIIGCLVSEFAHAQTIHSPNHKLTFRFTLSAAGEPTYQLSYGAKPVITPSKLGVLLQDQPGLNQGFTIARTDSSQHDDTWTPVWGEVAHIRNHYRELAVTLNQAGAGGHRLVLRFRVFDDGLGFRYEFPQQPGLGYFVVSDEATEFNLPRRPQGLLDSGRLRLERVRLYHFPFECGEYGAHHADSGAGRADHSANPAHAQGR